MRWSELDFETSDWLLPAERTKNKLDHILPLSHQAVALISRLQPEERRTGPVITTNGEVGISGFSKLKDRLDALVADLVARDARAAGLVGSGVEHWVVHDLRRSITTCCQAMGIPLPVTEAILTHVSGSRAGIAGVYHMYDFYDEKADALQMWADLIDRALQHWEKSDVAAIRAMDPTRKARRNRRRGFTPANLEPT